MSLSQLKNKQNGQEILIPRLKKFCKEEDEAVLNGKLSKKATVIDDANLSIEAFKERIDEFNHDETDNLPEQYFHPSSISKCKRALFFDHYDAPQNSAAVAVGEYLRKHLIFEVGTYFHVLFQNLCERAGVLNKREKPIIDHDKKIIGHMDGELLIDGEKYALEIKTAGSWSFGKYSSSNAPDYAHVKQVTLYMGSLGLDKAIIIYYDKDRSNIKEFFIAFDPELYSEMLREIHKYRKNVKNKSLPDKEGDNPSLFPCRFCNFTEICFDTEKVSNFLDNINTNDNETKSAQKKRKKTKRTQEGSDSKSANSGKTKLRRKANFSRRHN